MADELLTRARAMLALMRDDRDAPLREQGSGGQPAAQSTISARESVDAITARHRRDSTPQSANASLCPPTSARPAPAPSTARATSTVAAVWHPLPRPAQVLPPAGSEARAASARAIAAIEQKHEHLYATAQARRQQHAKGARVQNAAR